MHLIPLKWNTLIYETLELAVFEFLKTEVFDIIKKKWNFTLILNSVYSK